MERFRTAAIACASNGADAAAVRELMSSLLVRTVVLVEGVSDQRALEALAVRRDRDLVADGICVVPMGGAMSIARFLRIFDGHGRDVNLCGLCDIGEESFFRSALEQSGFGSDLTRDAMEALGFYVCVADLEDELIRALGAASVVQVIAAQGDLYKFRTFQNQPAQRERPVERQLRRFMGTIGGRKAQYARALVLALEPDRIPQPLDRLFAGT
jgi:hypothetical protein